MNKDYNFYVESFLEMITVERGLSEKTLEAYKNDINDFLCFLRKKTDIVKVNEKILKKYIKNLANKKLTKSSIARKISSLKQFYGFLYSEKIRTDNPTISLESPKKENNLTKTKLFLDRRIEEVLKFGKKSGKLKSIVNNANISNKIINLIKEFNSKKTSS